MRLCVCTEWPLGVLQILAVMFGVKSLSTTEFLLPAQLSHSDEDRAEPVLGLNEIVWGWVQGNIQHTVVSFQKVCRAGKN